MTYPSVTLLIPCYNEADRIHLLFDGIFTFTSQWEGNYEVILIDDGSNDQTASIIKNHPTFIDLFNKKQISFIQQQNTGKGGALKFGMTKASMEFVLTLDADMATSPSQLIEWHRQLSTFDHREILIGSRELKQSDIIEVPIRKLAGNIFNFIIRSITGLPFLDTQCGFKLYPLPIAQAIFASLETFGWAHDVEILLRAKKMGVSIKEMPLKWRAIKGSKISIIKDSWKMFRDVIRIQRNMSNTFNL